MSKKPRTSSSSGFSALPVMAIEIIALKPSSGGVAPITGVTDDTGHGKKQEGCVGVAVLVAVVTALMHTCT